MKEHKHKLNQKLKIMIMRNFVVLASFIFLFGCQKEEIMLQTIAQKVSVSMINESGNSILTGDTIIIDEFHPKIQDDFELTDVIVSIKVDGLNVGELFMISITTNGIPNRVDCFGYEGSAKLYYADDIATYYYQAYNYAGIYKPTTTLKISFSDGSELWFTNPVKIIVDSSKHFAEISLRNNSYSSINGQTITVAKGEMINLTTWVESMGYSDYYYWTIVTSNYDQNGNNTSTGVLPGYNEKMDSNTKGFFIYSEPNVFKRDIKVKLIGYYCESNEVICTIIYQ